MRLVETYADLPDKWCGYCGVKYDSHFFWGIRKRPRGIYSTIDGKYWKLEWDDKTPQWKLELKMWQTVLKTWSTV